MEPHMERRARELVATLQQSLPNCGLLIMQGVVVMRCPGAPYSDAPTMYDEADLTNAIELNLVRKQKIVESYDGAQWDYYVAREHPSVRICSHCKDLSKRVSVGNGKALFTPLDGQRKIDFVHTACLAGWAEVNGVPLDSLETAIWPTGFSQL
jgi:hypothetical protein